MIMAANHSMTCPMDVTGETRADDEAEGAFFRGAIHKTDNRFENSFLDT